MEEMVEHLRRLFLYDDWANRETLASLKKPIMPPPRSLKLLAHILGAEWLWWARLQMQKNPLAVWPELSLEDCEKQIPNLAWIWKSYLHDLSPAKLKEAVSYVNSKGEEWKSTVEDVLTQVVLHSAYHRGQIAADMRASGHEPAYTDFIHCIRQGFVR